MPAPAPTGTTARPRRGCSHRRHRLGPGLVVDPHAALLAVQQPGLVQHLEVVADRGLGEVEGRQQVAHAGLAALVGQHQRHQPQAHRVGERLEQRHDLGGLLGASSARGPAGCSRPADRRGRTQTSTCVNTCTGVVHRTTRHRQVSMSDPTRHASGDRPCPGLWSTRAAAPSRDGEPVRVTGPPPRGYPGDHRHVRALHRAREAALRGSTSRARRDRSSCAAAHPSAGPGSPTR